MIMLTRHEVLKELRRIGIKEPSQLKAYLIDFEHYMERRYGLEIGKGNGGLEDVTDSNALSASD
jgi:hypothetical protein